MTALFTNRIRFRLSPKIYFTQMRTLYTYNSPLHARSWGVRATNGEPINNNMCVRVQELDVYARILFGRDKQWFSCGVDKSCKSMIRKFREPRSHRIPRHVDAAVHIRESHFSRFRGSVRKTAADSHAEHPKVLYFTRKRHCASSLLRIIIGTAVTAGEFTFPRDGNW